MKHADAKRPPARSKAQSIPTAQRDIDAATLARLRAAAAMPDEQIDLTDPDAPLVTDWNGAVQGKFFKPIKRLKSFRIDADVLAYFESQGKGYQTTVNKVLRDAMVRGQRSTSGGKAPVKRQARND